MTLALILILAAILICCCLAPSMQQYLESNRVGERTPEPHKSGRH